MRTWNASEADVAGNSTITDKGKGIAQESDEVTSEQPGLGAIQNNEASPTDHRHELSRLLASIGEVNYPTCCYEFC